MDDIHSLQSTKIQWFYACTILNTKGQLKTIRWTCWAMSKNFRFLKQLRLFAGLLGNMTITERTCVNGRKTPHIEIDFCFSFWISMKVLQWMQNSGFQWALSKLINPSSEMFMCRNNRHRNLEIKNGSEFWNI
jgi:hypothetical protein